MPIGESALSLNSLWYAGLAGSLPGYSYSAALKSSTLVWDEATLDRWLTNPAALVPGTAMAFAGLPKPEDRAALIAYLKHPAR
jgi:cytochrome c